MDSGDPRVVILMTNGLRVHSACVGQNGAPEARSRGVTSREITIKVSLPRRSWITAGDSRSGSKGVYRNVALSYGLYMSPSTTLLKLHRILREGEAHSPTGKPVS